MDASSYLTQPPNHSGNHHHHHNAAAPSSNSHQRSASHASYGSHTDMFDCDLNARDFFGGGGSNNNTSNNVTGDANNDVMTTSSGTSSSLTTHSSNVFSFGLRRRRVQPMSRSSPPTCGLPRPQFVANASVL
eukprot:scaffold44550_cov54-Cyclotella_meneghiniana.AAC.1